MSADGSSTKSDAPVTYVVGDAVGVGKTHWFIAIVNHNSEKQVAERLGNLGVESYLPVQTELRVWKNGRKKMVDRIVIPSTVFIHCTERERREVVKLPFINRFMTDKAGFTPGAIGKPIAKVPDAEISRLRFMLGQTDIPVEITSRPYRKGDRVRVIRGSLRGLEGEVSDMNASQSELTVELSLLGCAKLLIDTINLEYIGSDK